MHRKWSVGEFRVNLVEVREKTDYCGNRMTPTPSVLRSPSANFKRSFSARRLGLKVFVLLERGECIFAPARLLFFALLAISLFLPPLRPFRDHLSVTPQPARKGRFLERTGSETQNHLRGFFFGRCKVVAVHFEEKYTDDKTGPLVAVNEGVVADDPYRVGGSHVDDVG